jgi:hypothetical protein
MVIDELMNSPAFPAVSTFTLGNMEIVKSSMTQLSSMGKMPIVASGDHIH